MLTKILLLLSGTEDYLKEAYGQLDDKVVYEQVPNNRSVLANILMKALEKIRLQRDMSKKTIDYSLVKISNLEDFICYLKFTNDYMMCPEV